MSIPFDQKLAQHLLKYRDHPKLKFSTLLRQNLRRILMLAAYFTAVLIAAAMTHHHEFLLFFSGIALGVFFAETGRMRIAWKTWPLMMRVLDWKAVETEAGTNKDV